MSLQFLYFGSRLAFFNRSVTNAPFRESRKIPKESDLLMIIRMGFIRMSIHSLSK